MSDSLAAMQRWMLDALLSPGAVASVAVAEQLLPGPELDARACLAIYQRSYGLRLERCLAEQFPALCHAVGEGLFHDFASEYLRAEPSDSYTLYQLGRRFPAWLEASRPDRDQPAHAREDWIDFMVDLADYERALFCMFDAPGHEGGAWPDPDDDGLEDSALILQPCFALGDHRYPVGWYYHEVRAGRRPEFPPRQRTHVAMVRRDYQTVTYPISELHHRFLTGLRAGADIPQALAEIAEAEQQPLERVFDSWAREVRREWIAAGFFIDRVDP